MALWDRHALVAPSHNPAFANTPCSSPCAVAFGMYDFKHMTHTHTHIEGKYYVVLLII